ncbi:MAG: Alanine-tRNA ligase [Candidatus Amesbacteria bacterium GW2011_GWA2_47_11b]|uniref:alanine--tRNA ligase n=3 Tax=Candidatus Amesiibacteriota TaxID=1752730 RepID=A0A0G1SKU9_9BACT|nr:MAG: Alanine-tRNA ligase [Microgenomates group bacterium GW2011_GWC1_46_20]KKU57915.1 MAG: Alanine-tRNA ligase [Candidatus Amesbacteria bacterium GW2011_GWA2_47_11b]KKU70046.1 MAG: Alanine-tRNA ligase [Candidatus Amesbacteria bacterium GW2011_GWA1_47_20]KKU83977.1 MAG: Alanine-tRNA ligase [Candidatus Amesbacteria bacterium GW2011_GWC2_47_8]
MVSANDVRAKYLQFFKDRGHIKIPSALLVPENDPTTLFTSSGMQPLVQNLLGQPHPAGKRLVNSQKCFRAQDIDEVGDNRHTTFFEMLGNWSLGDYFKEEQLAWFYEFLTKELKLPEEKLAVSVFEGDNQIPRDEESAAIWKKLGVPKNRIFYYGVKKNWWSRSGVPESMPAGEPGGPDSEVFYEFTDIKHNPKFGDQCHPNCDCGRFLEIGNSVFMQYQKQADSSFKELPQKNVDFGGGLERLTAAASDEPDIFQTDSFKQIIQTIEYVTQKKYVDHPQYMRIIADHIKAATFLISDGATPSNKAQGYMTRRLIRQAAVKLRQLQVDSQWHIEKICRSVIETYKNIYFKNLKYPEDIPDWISMETQKFSQTLDKGLKLLGQVSPFDLYQSYGFPPEVIEELYQEKGLKLNKEEFAKSRTRHQEESRTASQGMFKGGLQDQSEIVTKYHTATHLLHAALRKVLGNHVSQKGSNITADRLRFDFSHPEKLTDEQIKQVEDLINAKIAADVKVECVEMPKSQALAEGALAFFPEKYPDVTSVYTIDDFSKELCGGPHVQSTGEIGRIKITRQEAVSAGVRRIYATAIS